MKMFNKFQIILLKQHILESARFFTVSTVNCDVRRFSWISFRFDKWNRELTVKRNSVLGVSGTMQRRLQSVFNAAARLVFPAKKSEHVTPLLQELHWLKVPERIQFRLCVLVHRCLHGNALPYLAETLYVWVWRWIMPPSQVWIDIDTIRAVNATSHSRWPCFSSGRRTGLESIAFVGQNVIVDVLDISSPAENTAIQGILWRPDIIALSICCTALTAIFFHITFCSVPLQHFFAIS